jgi:hypothetical protein
MESGVRAALEKFNSGDEETAFFELLEMPGELLPAIIAIFRGGCSSEARAFLVKVAWHRRDPAAVPFLREALMATEENIWQEALDGLVTAASKESLLALHSARARRFSDDTAARRFHLWLQEAIEQVESDLRPKT